MGNSTLEAQLTYPVLDRMVQQALLAALVDSCCTTCVVMVMVTHMAPCTLLLEALASSRYNFKGAVVPAQECACICAMGCVVHSSAPLGHSVPTSVSGMSDSVVVTSGCVMSHHVNTLFM